MRWDDDHVGRDESLSELLGRWDAPPAPRGLDERMLTRYRRAYVPFWRRFVTASIRVPLPVAVSVLIVAGAGLLSLRTGSPTATTAPPAPPPPATAARVDAPPVRTSLAGFRPVTEVTATVMTESE